MSADQKLASMSPMRRRVEEIAILHGFTSADVFGKRQTSALVNARYHAAYELRRMGPSLPRIGALLRRDHSTIHHALRRWPARAAALGIACEPLPEHLAPASKEPA